MMPKGKYFIGDLCYVLGDDWDEVCDTIIQNNKILEGEFTLKDGRKFATYSTNYGDGEYESNIKTSHSVDSGSIGCILVSDIKEEIREFLGAIVEFDNDFQTSSNNGIIQFGHVKIDTNY